MQIRENPILIVEAEQGTVGRVYLLSSDIYAQMLAKESNPATDTKYIGQQNVEGEAIYGAVFRKLIPDEQYMCWSDESDSIPISLSSGQVQKIHLKKSN